MTLQEYITQVQALLHNTTGTLYNTVDITRNINSARGQLAGESRSLRAIGTFTAASLTTFFDTSSIVLNQPSGNVGYSSVLDVREIFSESPTGLKTLLTGRPWEWYFRNYMSSSFVIGGSPREWVQLSSGVGGRIFVGPAIVASPGNQWRLSCDCNVLPNNLVGLSDVDCIAYPWMDAVQYFATYLCFLGLQRLADADRMFTIYQSFMVRGRQLATPPVLPQNFQSPTPAVGIGGQNAGGIAG